MTLSEFIDTPLCQMPGAWFWVAVTLIEVSVLASLVVILAPVVIGVALMLEKKP